MSKSMSTEVLNRIGRVLGRGDDALSVPRVVHVNNDDENERGGYADNAISTSKYTVITFLFLFLWQQCACAVWLRAFILYADVHHMCIGVCVCMYSYVCVCMCVCVCRPCLWLCLWLCLSPHTRTNTHTHGSF